MLDKEELEKFWKYFGFTRSHSKRAFHWSYGYKEQHWLEPSGEVTNIHGLIGRLPPLDMNSIEKWVWPKLDGFMMFTGEGGIHFIASKNGLNYLGIDKEAVIAVLKATRPLWDKEAE